MDTTLLPAVDPSHRLWWLTASWTLVAGATRHTSTIIESIVISILIFNKECNCNCVALFLLLNLTAVISDPLHKLCCSCVNSPFSVRNIQNQLFKQSKWPNHILCIWDGLKVIVQLKGVTTCGPSSGAITAGSSGRGETSSSRADWRGRKSDEDWIFSHKCA